jgi:hypothetical protein
MDVLGEVVGGIVEAGGYSHDETARVQAIVLKDGLGLGRDDEVQAHEDALCLVFLETQLSELAERLGDERTVEVLRKTLAKMGERGRGLALSLAGQLTAGERALVERALDNVDMVDKGE